MKDLIKWDNTHYQGGDGIVVATDENQEWYLKWWWEHYSKHNTLPVTFFDIGMSKSARLWCEKRGTVISFSLPQSYIAQKDDIPLKIQKDWEENYYGPLWECRNQWFNKPFALLKSPYDRTLWMDLDCEVRLPLDQAFDFCETKDGFSTTLFHLDHATICSTGVVINKRYSPVTEKWAEHVITKNSQYLGDDSAFMGMLGENNYDIHSLPITYNWLNIFASNCPIYIYHHMGSHGKTHILRGLNV